MTRTDSNAFLRSGQSFDTHPRGSLAGLLAPLRAVMNPTEIGQILTLSPLRFEDIKTLWMSFGDHRQIVNLLIDLETSEPRMNADRTTLQALAHESGAEVLSAFGDDQILVDDEALSHLFERGLAPGIRIVRITGPVEAIDAQMIEDALRQGRSPLKAELCAVASLGMPTECSLQLETRNTSDALRTVAESFRHYIAFQRRMPVSAIAPPATWQMQQLLDLVGEICVRPIETEVFSTSIDIGICSESGGPTRPANRSLIYDVFTNTWHDEP